MGWLSTIVIGTVVLGSRVPALAETFRSYHVGNSLTTNLLNGGKLQALSVGSDRQHVTGWHIRGSAPLNYMWANPSDISMGSSATFDHALPEQQWDAVTFQPSVTSFFTIPSTLSSDTQVIHDMISLTRTNPQNSGTRFFIYSAWPGTGLGAYETVWSSPPEPDDSPTAQSRAYYDDLYAAVSLQHPDIRMIPAGEAFFHINQRILSGEIPGLTSISDLYVDPVHLNELGCHVVGAVAYATMFGENPVGLPYSSALVPASPETIFALQEAAWDVVTTHSYTGVPEPTALALVASFGLIFMRRQRAS